MHRTFTPGPKGASIQPRDQARETIQIEYLELAQPCLMTDDSLRGILPAPSSLVEMHYDDVMQLVNQQGEQRRLLPLEYWGLVIKKFQSPRIGNLDDAEHLYWLVIEKYAAAMEDQENIAARDVHSEMMLVYIRKILPNCHSNPLILRTLANKLTRIVKSYPHTFTHNNMLSFYTEQQDWLAVIHYYQQNFPAEKRDDQTYQHCLLAIYNQFNTDSTVTLQTIQNALRLCPLIPSEKEEFSTQHQKEFLVNETRRAAWQNYYGRNQYLDDEKAELLRGDTRPNTDPLLRAYLETYILQGNFAQARKFFEQEWPPAIKKRLPSYFSMMQHCCKQDLAYALELYKLARAADLLASIDLPSKIKDGVFLLKKDFHYTGPKAAGTQSYGPAPITCVLLSLCWIGIDLSHILGQALSTRRDQFSVVHIEIITGKGTESPEQEDLEKQAKLRATISQFLILIFGLANAQITIPLGNTGMLEIHLELKAAQEMVAYFKALSLAQLLEHIQAVSQRTTKLHRSQVVEISPPMHTRAPGVPVLPVRTIESHRTDMRSGFFSARAPSISAPAANWRDPDYRRENPGYFSSGAAQLSTFPMDLDSGHDSPARSRLPRMPSTPRPASACSPDKKSFIPFSRSQATDDSKGERRNWRDSAQEERPETTTTRPVQYWRSPSRTFAASPAESARKESEASMARKPPGLK